MRTALGAATNWSCFADRALPLRLLCSGQPPRVNAPQLFELQCEPMAQWAFGSQFIEQLFRSLERSRFNFASLEYLAPSA
jgi:hypothetical protein